MFRSVSVFNLKSTCDSTGSGRISGGGSAKDRYGKNGEGGGEGETGFQIQKSYSMGNCIVEKKRGLKPSDRHDPSKRQFLIELSKQIWQKKNESSNVSKRIDLHKIFTPATDAEEILPKNRKLYASSAFYSPTLHPTVEDQVELARRISHSLSDISNQQSKGQSMYINRKKRSVKWEHEGQGKTDMSTHEHEYESNCKENSCNLLNDSGQPILPLDKVPLRLLMNPRGQMRDFNSMRESFQTDTGLLSPDKCAELVTALQTQKGKGAELFAKRRRKAENWVVDEINVGTQSPSGLPDYHQYQPKPPSSPSILPAYSDAGKHRVQLNMHQEQVLEKYAKPGLKVVKTPWEAALETGSASAAFVEEHKHLSPHLTPISALSPSQTPQYQYQHQDQVARGPSPYNSTFTDSSGGYQPTEHATPLNKLSQTSHQVPKGSIANHQRDLAYKPSLAQGWKAPVMTLPKDYSWEEQPQNRSLMQQQLMQQQYITEAANKCESFCSKDEAEIIGYIEKIELDVDDSKRNNNREKQQYNQHSHQKHRQNIQQQQQQQQLQQLEQNQQELDQKLLTHEHEFIDHLVRSPVLRVSPIPTKDLLVYDYAVHELQKALTRQRQQEQQQQQQPTQENQFQEKQHQHLRHSNMDDDDNNKQHQNVVDVQKQLRYLEQYQQQLLIQQQHAEMLQLQRQQHLSNKKQMQLLNQQQQQQHQTATSTTTTTILEREQNKNNELYVPKVIPLDSYAPPPPLSGALKQPSSSFAQCWQPPTAEYNIGGINQYATSQPTIFATASPAQVAPIAGGVGFPLTRPTSSGFSSNAASAPKQQHWAPSSYQTVQQQTTQAVPQVNFNPSPLPYDKLAKFDNPNPEQTAQPSYRYSPQQQQQQRHLAVQHSSGSSKVRNLSPTPFAGRVSGGHITPTPQQAAVVSYDTPPISSSTSPQRPPSQQYGANENYSGFGSSAPSSQQRSRSDLMHGQNFNSSARGWRTGATGPASARAGFGNNTNAFDRQQPPITLNTGNLPYSDF